MHEAVREQARHVADRSDRLTGKQYMAASAITGRRQISTTVRRHLARLVGCGSRRTHSPFAATTVWAGTACSCVCSASGQQPRDGRPRTLGRDSGRCDGSGSSCVHSCSTGSGGGGGGDGVHRWWWQPENQPHIGLVPCQQVTGFHMATATEPDVPAAAINVSVHRRRTITHTYTWCNLHCEAQVAQVNTHSRPQHTAKHRRQQPVGIWPLRQRE